MKEAAKQQNTNRMLTLVAELEARFTIDELEVAFAKRQIENELADIGAIHIGADRPDKDLVWAGYEIMKNSKYLVG